MGSPLNDVNLKILRGNNQAKAFIWGQRIAIQSTQIWEQKSGLLKTKTGLFTYLAYKEF